MLKELIATLGAVIFVAGVLIASAIGYVVYTTNYVVNIETFKKGKVNLGDGRF